jgi:hypothetical protein
VPSLPGETELIAATAPATGALAEEAVSDEEALVVPAPVRGAVVNEDAPIAARPVAAMEMRFSLMVLLV